jgi:hypothetical protein
MKMRLFSAIILFFLGSEIQKLNTGSIRGLDVAGRKAYGITVIPIKSDAESRKEFSECRRFCSGEGIQIQQKTTDFSKQAINATISIT